MKSLLKEKAIELRKTGASYGEIKRKLNVSKSTLSYWLKNVLLTDEQKKRLYTNSVAILTKGPKCQKERRNREVLKIIEDAEKEISSSISDETYKLFGAALYWAEGNKKKDFGITNSDPNLIIFIVKWFEKAFNIFPNNLKAWLNIYPQQNDLELKKFWSDLTGIPFKNFGKSFIKPLSKNYKKNNLYYGTIKIRVCKGTDLRHKTYGWIKAILKEVAPKSESIQNQWKSLKENARPINI